MRSEKDLRRATSAPIFGLIPEIRNHWWQQKSPPHEYLRQKPFSHYADAIRQVFATCRNVTPDQPTQTILLTSSLQDEGKTTTAISLAVAAAEGNRRTVLVDLDFHQCGASHTFELESDSQSLDDLLQKKCTLAEATFRHPEIPFLDVIGFSNYPSNADNLLNPQTTGDLIETLKEKYEVVIVDTPPALISANTGIIAGFADVIIMMMRWNQTESAALSGSLKRLRQASKTPVGIAISRVNFSKQAKMRYDPAAKYQAFAQSYYRN